MAAYKASKKCLSFECCPKWFSICIIFFLAQKWTKRSPNIIERPNMYESAKVARSEAAQRKLNVQKYDKA